MRPITGGNVPPKRVIGRDAFIKKMWDALENQSILLVAERRIGKTSVIKKMEAEPLDGWRPIYLVVEGVKSPTEFISNIFDAVSPILSKKEKMLGRFLSLYQPIAGKVVGNWSLPELKDNWKRLLHAILTDIKDNFEKKVVFLWDELPLMISNIKDELGDRTAMEVLDVLRDQRVADNSGKLRMVFTGSIGLHLVVSELSRKGYKNDPINDMVTYSLEGLEPEYANELASQGLQGLIDEDGIEVLDSVEDVAKAIAESTDRLPYYINYTVVTLSELGHPIQVADVEKAIGFLVQDPDDTAHFRHYAERINAYYLFHEEAKKLAFLILKILCHKDQATSEDGIWDEAVAKMELSDRNFFQSVLEMLLKDHYIKRQMQSGERTYQFKYNIIKRWWLTNRG